MNNGKPVGTYEWNGKTYNIYSAEELKPSYEEWQYPYEYMGAKIDTEALLNIINDMKETAEQQ